ncbi:hypothetical protein ABBQ32_006025 [Trebouxia sp. C0010 RCD-2024]
MGIVQQCLPGVVGQEVVINSRRFRVVKLLGEGGYSFVYLVRELPTDEHPAVPESFYALKKVLAGSNEQLVEAQKEVKVMTKLHHPNLLPLLAQAIVPDSSNGHMLQLVYMLFPVYEEGSLLDEVTRRQNAHNPLTSQEVLHIFLQVTWPLTEASVLLLCSTARLLHNRSSLMPAVLRLDSDKCLHSTCGMVVHLP